MFWPEENLYNNGRINTTSLVALLVPVTDRYFLGVTFSISQFYHRVFKKTGCSASWLPAFEGFCWLVLNQQSKTKLGFAA